jgi:hypothetical protein
MVRGHDILALIVPGDWDVKLSMLAELDDTHFINARQHALVLHKAVGS